MDALNDAVEAQFIEDVVGWLEWLDGEYEDVDVPTDRTTAAAVVDLVADPRLVQAQGSMPDEAFEEMQEVYRESRLLQLMLGRESIAMRGESLTHDLVPPSGAPEGMHR